MKSEFEANKVDFQYWEILKDMTDQLIDLMLNLRQSGHPGGSRSKVHLVVSTLLGGAMRWDIRHPEKRFTDRFVLSAGHAIPVIYAFQTICGEAMKLTAERTGKSCFLVNPDDLLLGRDLIGFRRRGGLPGHAEMSGKTHFLKYNTGPSGHGLPAAAGLALALKRAGAGGVRVFALEGEGGLTPGATMEVKNSAWGLGLDNLYLLLDWNDFGIDPQTISSVVPGDPNEWFSPSGWRVETVDNAEDWAALTSALERITETEKGSNRPALISARSRKGRGYLKYDASSHGAPHSPMNCEAFWATKGDFAKRYGIKFEGFGEPAPETPAEQKRQTAINIDKIISVLRENSALTEYLADRLLTLGDSVPEQIETFRFRGTGSPDSPCSDSSLFDPATYPDELWARAGTKVANKDALGAWGKLINNLCRDRYQRPLFLACSADLAQSTSIAGFAGDWGWYERETNPEGVLLPQEITEFTNASLMTGAASVNFAANPAEEFDGFYGVCSTYGAFSYLKYGPMRLFSQLAQDSALKVGKVIWVAGHSGPETADDSRTHFGIFAPGVTGLFPRGSVVEIHPWEYNEVPVMLAAAMNHGAPIIALHLTRPPITIPDRPALGLPSFLAAGRGAYVIREYKNDQPRMGTVMVQGTSTTAGVIDILPELTKLGVNVKIVAVLSSQLFEAQSSAYREETLSETDRCDAMIVTNRALKLAGEWIAFDWAEPYSLSSDWDNRWRTGGTIDEILEEAHLSADWILEGIKRFADERDKRRARIKDTIRGLQD